MSNEEDLLSRIPKVKSLREECFKYLEPSSQETLTHQVILTLAKLTSEKMGPVKLAELAQTIHGTAEKSKQDVIRLTIEKSLLKCGIVEKLRYAPNDVRYILNSYRFQKIRKIESIRGDSAEKIGDVFELPKSTWPIPDEYFVLQSKKFGYDEVLKKINSDFDKGLIPRGKYEDLVREYREKLSQISKKLSSKFSEIEDLVV
ncbi:MAG: hypothetical protein IIA83_06905 [Thaumarchaeota archaeon]|nr:hypothetical protein [Nitrososphaerota archaeon]